MHRLEETSEVCQRAALTNEVIDEKIINRRNLASEYWREGQPVVPAGARMSDAIYLDNTSIDRKIEQAREGPGKHSRYYIHSLGFERMHREQKWMRRAYDRFHSGEIRSGHYVLNEALGCPWIPLFCRRV